MTGQWVSMGPLLNLMQQQQFHPPGQQQMQQPSYNGMDQQPWNMMAPPSFANDPYNMVGYNLVAPPGGGVMPPQMGGGVPSAGAEAAVPPGEPTVAAPSAPDRVTISQVFSWQVCQAEGGPQAYIEGKGGSLCRHLCRDDDIYFVAAVVVAHD